MPSKPPPTPYWDYIKVEQLLALQTGIGTREAELSNDEVMFIVVHQIDELWFKLALREMVSVRNLFARVPVPEQALASAVRGIRRMETILRQLAAHFELMETMTTRDYLAFRDKLTGASGFQSAQMREIEIVMGLPELERVPLGHEGSYLTALKEHDGSESPALRRVRASCDTGMISARDKLTQCLFKVAYGLRPIVNGGLSNCVEAHCGVEGFGRGIWRIDIYLTDHPIMPGLFRRGKEVGIE